MKGKFKWLLLSAVSIALLIMCNIGDQSEIVLKPDVYIQRAYACNYNGDRYNGFVDARDARAIDDNVDMNEIPKLPVKKIVKLMNVTSTDCTLIFTIGDDHLYCVDHFALKNLDTKSLLPQPYNNIIAVSAFILFIFSVVMLAIKSIQKETKDEERTDG